MLTLDHIVIATETLATGAPELERALGAPLQPGGEHAAMGTHNRLLSLGPDLYLELIAINTDAPGPDQPRWYNLDNFAGPPRLTHWAARTDDLDASLMASPEGAGTAWDLSRGDLRWRFGIPESGQHPFDGLFPALLQWQSPHPAPGLTDHGIRLETLTLASPEAAALKSSLAPLISDPRIKFTAAETPRLSASLHTPNGTLTL